MTNGKRDYQKEKRWEHEKNPQRLKDRVKRIQARREAIKAGVAKRFDGKQVDHKVPLSKGGSNSMENLRAVSPSSNMSFSRNRDGSLRSQTSNRERKHR
jgi:5-methylcytosine-specific restriction endonuclease McrA